MSKITKDKALEVIQGLPDGAEVILRKPEEEETFLKNYKEAEIERDLKSRVGKLYDDIDNDVYEVTGQKKEPREKTYDFIKRVLEDYKAKASDTDAQKLKDEIARLKKEGVSGDIVKELENVRASALKEKQTLLDRLTQTELRISQKDVEMALNDGLRDLKFTAGIPKSVLDTYLDVAKRDLISTAKIVEGRVVFTDKEGNTVNDPATYQPMSAQQMLKTKLSDVIDAGHQGQGAGTDPPKTAVDKDGKKYPLVVIPATVKNRRDLTKHLMSLGMATGTADFDGAYAKYGKDLPL